MSEFLQSWLKDAVLKIVSKVLQKEIFDTNIEQEIKNIEHKSKNRVQIAKFEKCPTQENPNEECVLYIVDRNNCIMAKFSLSAINNFYEKHSDIALTSLRGCFIILKSYYFNYDRESRQLYICVDEFEYIGGQANVYSDDMQSVNEIPSIKTFTTILNNKIQEEQKEGVFHYGWNGIDKLSDEDCYVSSEDRSILDKLPGWSDIDSPFLSSKDYSIDNNITNGNDTLFDSQSIFEIVDLNSDDNNFNLNQYQNSDFKENESKKIEKRYRDSISESGNEMTIEEENIKTKRMKIDNFLDSQNIMFSQSIDNNYNQDIFMETNSNLSDHLSSGPEENLTKRFAPAGQYSYSSSGVSEITESETDKDISLSETYYSNNNQNEKTFNIEKIIDRANLYSQFDNLIDDNNSDEIVYESQNFDNIGSPSASFINDNSLDTQNQLIFDNEYLNQNSSNNILNEYKDYMNSDNFQYMWE